MRIQTVPCPIDFSNRAARDVLGEHARDVVRHLFTRDTIRGVVHAASCPVWIVTARAAA